MSSKLTKESFEAETKEGTSLIKFEADWCGPCKKMTEILSEVEKDVTGVKFFTVDVDAEPELTKNFGIRGIPFTLKVVNGETVDSITGVQEIATIKKFILGNIEGEIA